jgi:hypothetical protein
MDELKKMSEKERMEYIANELGIDVDTVIDTSEQHGEIVEIMTNFLNILNQKYDTVDIIFALANVLDMGLISFEEYNKNNNGGDLRKTIVIGLTSENLKEAKTKVENLFKQK